MSLPPEARRAKVGGRLACCDTGIVLPVSFLRDLVLLQFLVQVAARCVDYFRGFGNVPPVLAQFCDEVRALGAVLELAERAGLDGFPVAAFRYRRNAGGPKAVRQIRRLDRVAGRHDDQPLDRVPKLADIPLPSMALERVERRLGNP